MAKISNNILIVDDEKQIRDLLYNILKTQNFKVYWAKNGNEALEILKNKPIDLVITDISMPGMDGNELANHIRYKYKEVPVVILSALGTRENFIKALKHGAVDFLVKGSFEPLKFVERIQKYLKGTGIIDADSLKHDNFSKNFEEVMKPVERKIEE